MNIETYFSYEGLIYDYNNLEAENIEKITPRWANGGTGRRARFRT